MTPLNSRRVRWLLWFAVFGLFVALALYPESYRVTRAATVALALAVWFGFIALIWKQRVLRFILLGLTLLSVGFVALPSRGNQADRLRADYLTALRRYDGVTYFWGGENALGIDCSGLIRRGLIDTMLVHGVRTLDGGLIRSAIDLWWNDCSARALGEGYRNLTTPVLETPSVNALDHSLILPGDLAVTKSGVHIMAYLGNGEWIEADPEANKVITLTAPSRNGWFHSPMQVVRWNVLR